MTDRASHLTIKDLNRTLTAHRAAIETHKAQLAEARLKVREGIEAHVAARCINPCHQLSDAEFERLLGGLTDTCSNIASDAAAEGYILGRIPGFRLGFELAGLMALEATPALPGIDQKELPVWLAVAMTNDVHASEIIKAMMELKGEAD